VINWLKKIYSENTIIGIAIFALAVFFLQFLNPEKAKALIEYLTPLFILVVCIEILFIRDNSKKLDRRLSFGLDYQSFNTGEEFDNYLSYRVKSAKSIKVVHVSSQILGEGNYRRYCKIMHDFIKAGNSVTRVFAETDNIDIYKWVKDDLLAYQNDRFFAHLLDKVQVRDLRTIGIMLIDEEEVCLGGGYVSSFQDPTISVKNKQIFKFFSDYFDYLKENSINLKTNENLKVTILEKKIKLLESSQPGPAT
jgi:hypothetical protein